MRVGFTTTSFPRFDGDTAGSFVLGFARTVARLGHQVTVLAPEPGGGTPPVFPGIETRWIPYLRPRSLQKTFYGAGVPDNLAKTPLAWLGVPTFLAQLSRTTRNLADNVDVVISHWALPSGIVAAQWARKRRHICVLHSADLHLLGRLPARRLVAQRILSRSERIVFVCSEHQARFNEIAGVSFAPNQVSVMPMGFDPATPSNADRGALRRKLGLSTFTILVMSRLVPIKGIQYAIRAVANSPFELVIAGEGPERVPLQRLAHAENARVRFVGHIDGDVKANWLHAVDAFALASIELESGRTEGTPTALLEALHAGLPVVASAVGGVPELLHSQAGLLVQQRNALALRGAFERLASDAHLRVRLRSEARRLATKHTWHARAPLIAELLGSAPNDSATTKSATDAKFANYR